jgi:hypothetical protein
LAAGVAAALVKSDLVKKVSSILECGRRSFPNAIAFDMWCRFMCRLLDGNLTTLHQLHIRRDFNSKNETIEAFEKLMVEVGSRCRGLKLFETSILFHNEEFHHEDHINYTWLEPIFF